MDASFLRQGIKDLMMPPRFCKTLLALAVAGGAVLPAYAQTLQLTGTGLSNNNVATTFTEAVEVTGSLSGTGYPNAIIDLNSVTFKQDLVLNANVAVSGASTHFGTAMMDFSDSMGPNRVGGSLINKGSIAVIGNASTAMILDPALIDGNLVNEGTLSAKGEPELGDAVRALAVTNPSSIAGDLINAASGKIIAEGTDATGVLLTGSDIGGRMTNLGLIKASGTNATAVDITPTDLGIYKPTQLAIIENQGTIRAAGTGTHALLIDGAMINRIENTGIIQADGTAIDIGTYKNTAGAFQGGYLILNHRAGLIAGGDAAINAHGGLVDLEWFGGKIQGNILGLGGFVGIAGGVEFDGARIETAEGVDVGSSAHGIVGHLELNRPHTRIDGDLNVAANSSLGMSLSSATDPNVAVLGVTGTAAFEQGSQIKLAAKGSDFSADGTTYKLVEAGSIHNQGLSVASSSALLDVNSYAVNGNQIVAKVTAKGSDQVAEVIQQTGASSNAQAAGTVFYGDVFRSQAASGSNDPAAQAYLAASQAPAALQDLTEQLAPEVDGGANQAALSSQTLIRNVIGSRTSAARGLSSGDTVQQAGVWVQGLYSAASQDLRDGVAGYNAYSRGIAVGADGKLNDQLTLGLAYSFLNTDVNGKTGNKTEVDSHAFTLYSGYEQGNYFVDASLTYGANDNSSKRYIAGTLAKGDYDSELLGLNLVGGYGFQLDNGLLVEPRVAARYSNVKLDGYREKGSSAALKVEEQRYEVAEVGAGVRLAGSFAAGRGTLEPQAKLMAYHDFVADRVSSTSTFVQGSTPFVTNGAKPARNSYEAGVGVDYRLGAVTLGVSYDYFGKSDFDADTVQAKLRYDF